jgi:F-type H+-transporting ATPase subunit b
VDALPATFALALSEGGAQIYPNGSLIVIFILFLIFVFLMNRLLFKPLGRVLDEREVLTDGAKAEARAATHRYGSRLTDYEAAIKGARAEGYRKLEQARAARLEDRRRAIEEAKTEAASEIERARAEIGSQAQQARADLAAESRQIAEQISRTVLGRTVGGGAD